MQWVGITWFYGSQRGLVVTRPARHFSLRHQHLPFPRTECATHPPTLGPNWQSASGPTGQMGSALPGTPLRSRASSPGLYGPTGQ